MRLAPLPLLLFAFACGDSLSVNNASPEGSVGGLVVDASSRVALEGASITLVAGGDVSNAEVTAADGSFRFTGVPFGTVLLLIEPPTGSAYAPATVHGRLAGEAGDFPVGNEALTIGPIGLVPTAAAPFRFRVLDIDGAPVTSYNVAAQTTVEWVDYSNGPGVAMGERIITAVTDNDGYAAIPGLPEYWRLSPTINDGLVVNLPPLDQGSDGIYEYPGGFTVFNLLALGNPTPDVILDPAYTTSLSIQASSIDALSGGGGPSVLGTTNEAWVKFNLPITQDVGVVVGNEAGQPVSAPTVEVEGDTLRLGFAGLSAGAEYNFSIHAVAAVGDHAIEGNFWAPFFTKSVDGQVSIVSATRDGPTTVRVVFSEPIGLGYGVALSGSNCVLFFNADLGGASVPVGDVPGEIGNPDCESGRSFSSEEPDPQGPVGLSGFTTRWIFDTYNPYTAGPLGPGTQTYVMFSHIPDPSARPRRVDGTHVNDIMTFTLP